MGIVLWKRALRGPLKIAGIYLLVGVLWILFSDRVAAALAPNEEALIQISLYKGWGFILMTAVLLYWLVLRQRRQMNEVGRNFRLAAEYASDVIWIMDPAAGKFKYISPSIQQLRGYTPEEVMSQSVEAALIPGDLEHLATLTAERLSRFQAQGTGTVSFTDELDQPHKNGSIVHTEVTTTYLFNELNEIEIVGVTRDLSPRNQAEQELQQQYKDFELINEINAAVIRGESLDAIMSLLVTGLNRMFASEGNSIYLLTPDGKAQALQQYFITPEIKRQLEKLVGGTIPLFQISLRPGGYFENIVSTGRGQVDSDPETIRKWLTEAVDDASLPPEVRDVFLKSISQFDGSLNIRSILAAPIMQNSKAIGVLQVAGSSLYSERDLKRLETISGQLTAAIQRRQADEQVLRSEKFLRSIQNALSANIAILDQDGTIVQVNSPWRKYAEQNGLTHPQHGIGLNYLEVCDSAQGADAEQAPLVASAIREVIAGKRREFQIEYPCHSPEEKRWFNLRITKFDDGDQLWVVLAHENITESKWAEQALRESEGRYRALFENMPVAIWEEDFSEAKQHLDGLKKQGITDFHAYFESHRDELKDITDMIKIRDVNHTAVEMYKAKNKAELIYHTDTNPGEGERENIIGTLVAITEGRTSHSWEGGDQTLAGDPIDINLRWSVVPGHEQDYAKVIVTTTDITDRRRAEESLSRAEAQYRSLVEQIPAAVYLWELGERGRCHYISPRIETMLGFTVEEWLSDPDLFFRQVHPDDREYAIAAENHSWNTGQRLQSEFRMLTRDGRLIWVRDEAMALPGNSSYPRLNQGILIDITEQKQAENELRISEERFRQLAENIQEVFWMTDAITGENIYVSPAIETIWGLPLENSLGNSDSFIESILPEDRPTVMQTLATQKSGKRTEMEYRIKRPDGSVRWVWDRAFPIFDNLGRVTRLAGIAADITERKELEVERSLLTSAIAASLNEIYLFDADTLRFTFANDGALLNLGYTLGEILQLTPLDLKPEFTLDSFQALIAPLLRHEKPAQIFETVHRRANGTLYPVEVHLQVFERGEQHFFLAVIQDITARKKSETALRESEAQFAGVVNSAMDAVISVDSEQRIVLFNPAAEQVFECQAHEALGQPLERFLPLRYRERHKEHLLRFGQSGITNRAMGDLVTLTGLRANGTEFPIEASISHIEVSGQHQFTIILRDITERKQVEGQIRKLSRAVEQSASSIVITDKQGRIEYVNPKFSNVTGYTFNEVVGQNPRILKSGHTPAEAYQAMWQAITSGREWQGEFRNRKKSGELYWEMTTISPILNEQGETTHFIAIKEDITERKQTEADVRRHLIELEALYENGLAVGRLLETREIGQQIIATFSSRLNWHHVAIRLLKEASDELELIAFSAPQLTDQEKVQVGEKYSELVHTTSQGLSGWAIQTGQLIRAGNVHQHPQYVDTYPGIQSGMYMPLKIGERILGVISVESDIPEVFSAQDERLLATLANQAAIAFENARLYQSAQQELVERKRAEEALRASETHYRELANSITDVFFEMDQDLQYTYWNKASERLTGIPVSQAMGKSIRDIFGDSEEQARTEQIYRSVLESHQPKTFEAIFNLNLRERSFEINAYPSARGVSVMAKDVTERKRNEILMQKRFELMEYAASHTLPELMQKTLNEISEWTHSTTGFFQFIQEDQVTPSMQIWSTDSPWQFHVAEGKTMPRLMDQAEAWAEAIRQRRAVIQNKYPSSPEGQAPVLREIILPVIRNEKIVAIIGVGNKLQEYTRDDLEIVERFADYAWDITERKQMEIALAEERNQLARRVEERTAELIRANSNLGRALRVKDEFLASMSHELRTPLNAILGLSESLAEQIAGPLNEKQLKYITTISESGHHLLALINDILDLAKIEAGQIVLDINKVDVNSVCHASLRMIRQLAQKKNQTVSLDIEDGIGLMWADERRLKQMMVNLLSNAVKFTHEGGSLGLVIRGDREGNKIMITVWDNGIGIREGDLPRLFKPFVQLDSGLARETAGTGLGLALVAQMARLHGGSVNITSEPDEGSRFTIELPWEPALAHDPVERMKITGKFRPVKPNTKQQSILLIEDTQEVTMILKDYLEMDGYRVTIAQDGLDGIEQAKLTHPDLILMDIQMPRMDGLEATRRLKQEPEFQNTPIIALTALAMPNDREKCLAAGMDEYISKPVNLKTLSKIIQHCLSVAEERSRPQ